VRLTDRRIAIAVGAIGALAYVALGIGEPSAYDYYGRLAEAFAHGRWWLTDDPPWLNELLTCGAGRFCVAYPPLPAVLTLPFLAFSGTDLAQTLMSQLAGGASAGILYLALRAVGAPRLVSLTGVVLSTFGTTLLFTSVDGRAWYAAHAVAMLFTSLALLLAARGGPPWSVGAAIGLAALARLPVAAVFPAIALLVARRRDISYVAALRGVVLGGLPLALVYAAYDVLRWGTPFDAGYARLAEGDFFFNFGLFSPLYVPRHFYAIFMESPDFVPGSPAFLRFRTTGMSLFLTTPALLWVFAALRFVRRDTVVRVLAIAAGLALLPNVLHGTVGFAQFGYRFSIDAQPFLIALALAGDSYRAGTWRARPSWLFLAATVVAVVMNVYATIVLVHLGFWS
jgi:hypothetical protein